MAERRRNRNCTSKNQQLLTLCFADYQLVMSNTQDNVQKAVCKLNQIITEHVLSACREKKNLMTFKWWGPVRRRTVADNRIIYICIYIFFFPLWRCGPTRAMTSSFLRFLDHTQWRITVGRTPMDERPARRRDLYLTTHNTHNRQISMPPVGFEPTISAGERPQTYALDRAATGTITEL